MPFIRNKATGEVKEVSSQDLGKYNVTLPKPSPSPSPQPTTKTDKETEKALGGYLPLLGAILGGGLGTFAGPGVGNIAGAGAGGMAGKAIEQWIDQIVKKRNRPTGAVGQQSLANVRASLGEGVKGGAGELLGLGIARVGGRLLRPFGRLLGEKLPRSLVKAALPETPKVAQKAVEKSAAGVGKELSEEVIEREIVGGPKRLIRKAHEMIGFGKPVKEAGETRLTGLVEEKLQAQAQKITKKVPFKKILKDSIEEAKTRVTGSKTIKAIEKAGADLLDSPLPGKKAITKMTDLIEMKRAADLASKGQPATDFAAANKKVNAALANAIRKYIRNNYPKLSELLGEEEVYMRLLDAAKKQGAKPTISRGDIIPLIAGFGGGTITGAATQNPLAGLLTGVGMAGAARLPFMPGFSTRAAQVLPQAVRRAGQVGTQVSRGVGQVGARSVLQELLGL